MPWLLAGFALLGIAVALGRRAGPRAAASTAARYAYPSFVRNRKVTNASANSDGWVTVSPRDLARQAKVDPETYALARSIGSEWASGTAAEKAAIAWAIINRARQRGWSVEKLSTFTSREGDRGLFGSQEHGRNHSTARDPTDRDIYVATMVLAGRWPDETGGATKFFDPVTQDILHRQWQRGERAVRYRSAAEIIAKWTGEGNVLLPPPPGVDPQKLALFRQA